MKTITKDGISLYIFNDDVSLVMTESNIEIVDEVIFGHLNSSNSIVYENVTVPQDWEQSKYIYNGEWLLNPNHVSPEQLLEQNKQSLKLRVSDLSKLKRDSGIIFNGLKVSTDEKARSLLNGALADADGNIKFVTSTGGAILTEAQFAMLYNAVRAHIRDCFANEYDLTAAIDAATTQDELNAIDVNAGWPE